MCDSFIFSGNIVGLADDLFSADCRATMITWRCSTMPFLLGFQNGTDPVTDIIFPYGQVVPVNASTSFIVTVGAYPGAVYAPVSLEITVPYLNGSNVYSICRVEVISVGSNLPCVNQAAMNASVQYYTQLVTRLILFTPTHRYVKHC